MNKLTDLKSAIDLIHEGDTILMGGFGNIGCPMHLLYELASRPEIRNLTLVSEDFHYSESDLGYVQGPEALLKNGQLKKVILSFIGSHKGLEAAIQRGEVELEFSPQGTLIERIRCAGVGFGGFYTPTGVGTEVEQGKETRVIDGKTYLLEKPLRGDVALIKAYRVDPYGNAVFKLTANNFNTAMALAAKTVILEAEELVGLGEIEPDAVHLPGIFVDHIVVEKGALV